MNSDHPFSYRIIFFRKLNQLRQLILFNSRDTKARDFVILNPAAFLGNTELVFRLDIRVRMDLCSGRSTRTNRDSGTWCECERLANRSV